MGPDSLLGASRRWLSDTDEARIADGDDYAVNKIISGRHKGSVNRRRRGWTLDRGAVWHKTRPMAGLSAQNAGFARQLVAVRAVEGGRAEIGVVQGG